MNMKNREQSAMRRHMIDGQLLPNDVTDQRVVDAIEKVDRAAFVPAARTGVAYIDKNIQISKDRYLLEPMAFAKLLSAADIQEDELVLDIGTASGYSSAVFSNLVDSVVSLEEDEELATLATDNLAHEGCDNVAVINGCHKDGLAKQGPYNLIFINGMVDEIPIPLLGQLTQNGRLLCILNQNGFGRAALITFRNNVKGVRVLFDYDTPKLKSFEKKKEFEF